MVLDGAIDYIKDMQDKIEELENKLQQLQLFQDGIFETINKHKRGNFKKTKKSKWTQSSLPIYILLFW